MPRALAYARSLVRHQDLAEDIVHDCYYRLLQKAAVYDLPRDGLRILLRAISNAAIDLRGRQRPLRSLGVGGAGEFAEAADVVDRRMEEPVAVAMTRELEQALEAGLAKLPLAQRAAFQMKSLGHSLQEIADALNVSIRHA